MKSVCRRNDLLQTVRRLRSISSWVTVSSNLDSESISLTAQDNSRVLTAKLSTNGVSKCLLLLDLEVLQKKLAALTVPEVALCCELGTLILRASKFQFQLNTCQTLNPPSTLFTTPSHTSDFPLHKFRLLLASILPYTSTEKGQYELDALAYRRGVWYSTDGRRVGVYHFPLSHVPDEFTLPDSSYLDIIRRSLPRGKKGTGTISFDKEYSCEIAWGKWRFQTRLLAGPFPPYQNLIPDNQNSIVVNKDEICAGLLDAQNRVDPSTEYIGLDIDSGSEIAFVVPEGDIISKTQALQLYEPRERVMWLNRALLLQGIKPVTSETVVLKIGPCLKPCYGAPDYGPIMIHGEDPCYQYVLMPKIPPGELS